MYIIIIIKVEVAVLGSQSIIIHNNSYGLCGRKATLENRARELCEGRGGRPGLPVPDSPYGLCGRRTIGIGCVMPITE